MISGFGILWRLNMLSRMRVNKGTCVTGGKYFVWCLKYDDKAGTERTKSVE